ncbi:MAG TPA: helix-turn-helix transcriptional regulator [Thermoanaerobaculia bacterium]|jgi:transcriptional regulator with XRE-family HTH domain|nr:helix-turn-helix transcriptional regulator [Thermoanaerobaculia bacterium]
MASEPRKISPDDEVALTITLLRQVRGWNQDDLAKASGVGNSAISDYERARKLPSLSTLNRLLDCMGFPLAAIDITRQYVQTLRAGGNTFSPIAPIPTTVPATPLQHESALRWEIDQAVPDLARAFARVVRIVLLLLLRCARPPTEDQAASRGLPRP